MRVLLVHNYYKQPGGEDGVFTGERALLEQHGHRVLPYTVSNERVDSLSSARLGIMTLWNRESYTELENIIRRDKPDLVHFHNTFPLISPAAYYATKAAGLPVVQALHNYRLLCSNALFFRNGQPCEDCLGKTPPWPGLLHACYHDSCLQTAGVVSMLTLHRWLRTWSQKVDIYIALSEFSRQKFIQGGLPPQKIMLKANFVSPDLGMGAGDGGFALFVGRLSPEKGVDTLLEAWKCIKGQIPLKIVGDGPLNSAVAQAAAQDAGIEWLGQLSSQEVLTLMERASFLVFPSACYENLSRVLIEAFSRGTPVLASDLGAAAEIVAQGRTGLHFPAGDAEALAQKALWLWEHPAELAAMRRETRVEYETKYTAERNYEQLMQIYETALRKV